MNNAVKTVPHVFYDLIARILPGSLFFFLLRFEGVDNIICQHLYRNSENSINILLDGIAFVVISYFAGWVLSALSAGRLVRTIRRRLSEIKGPDDYDHPMQQRYYEVRMRDELSGFRILKLRAEARMLESVITGSAIVLVIILADIIFLKGNVKAIVEFENIIRVSIPIIIIFSFQTMIKSAWEKYFESIETHHQLLFKDNGVAAPNKEHA
jgi:hypothetical protein